jgi:Ser/Thr protein kinase RdoA (MazF antagonist)
VRPTLEPRQAGLAVPEPQRNLSGALASLEAGVDRTDPAIRNIVRLLKFIPGKTFYEIGRAIAVIIFISFSPPGTWSTEHFVQCGEFIARMDNSLATFSHPAYDSRQPQATAR